MHAYDIILGLAAGPARADCRKSERSLLPSTEYGSLFYSIINTSCCAVNALEELPWQPVP